VVTTTITGNAGTRRRDKSAPRGEARIVPSPAEARLLSLRLPAASSAVVLEGDVGWFCQTASYPSAPSQPMARPERRRRSYGGLLFWLSMLALFAVGNFVIDRGGSTEPFRRLAPAPFSAQAAGSGRLTLHMAAGDSLVRVAIEPATSTADGWFWCFESDRGLPPEQHFCSKTGVRDPATGALASDGVVHVDRDSLATGTTFYVQLYCPDDCRWRADVLPPASP